MKRRHILAALALAALTFLSLRAQQSPPATQAPEKPPAKTEPAGSKPEKRPSRKRVVTVLSGFEMLGSDKKPEVVGATRWLERPVALAPWLGKVYGLNPVFAWSYAPKAENFVFVLTDDAKKEIFRAEVKSTQYRYPADAPRLEPGKSYFWTAQLPLGALGMIPSTPVGFIVASSGQREEIETALAQVGATDAYEQALARARVFTKFRLWYDAVDAYSDLIARYSSSAESYEQRGMIYAQIEATKALADADFARADQLHPGQRPGN